MFWIREIYENLILVHLINDRYNEFKYLDNIYLNTDEHHGWNEYIQLQNIINEKSVLNDVVDEDPMKDHLELKYDVVTVFLYNKL